MGELKVCGKLEDNSQRYFPYLIFDRLDLLLIDVYNGYYML